MLVSDIEEFEEILSKHFYILSKKLLTLSNCYTDWLVKYLRKNQNPINTLVTSYLIKKTNKLSENVQVFFYFSFYHLAVVKIILKLKSMTKIIILFNLL